MKGAWKLQDAKAQFSKVVDEALKRGPQYVTRHGQNAVVILSVAEYEQLVSEKPSFTDFLLSVPKLSDTSIFDRKKDFPRSIDL